MLYYKNYTAEDERYDVFFCLKIHEDNGSETPEKRVADELYKNLTSKGYKVFYSEESLLGKAGAAYEAMIWYALQRSSAMLIILNSQLRLVTPWVRNEYIRYVDLMRMYDSQKKAGSITLLNCGNEFVESVPGFSVNIQAIAKGKKN